MSQASDQIFIYLYLSILLSSVGLSESCVDEVYLVLWTLVEEVYISLSFVLILWTALSMDFEGFPSRSPISS